MKGQLRINQTSFIILIIVFIIFFGFVTFYKYSEAGIEQEALDYEFDKFQGLVHVIPSMPEFQCFRLGVGDDCMDVAKMTGFSRIEDEDFNGRYMEFFEDKVITVEEVHLSQQEWILFDGEPDEWENEMIVSTLVSLYYPNNRENGVGKLEIRWYS